jgi:nonsense-mediated mRNA decay protein 3
MFFAIESNELLAMFLRKVSSSFVATKIIDASWIWTEPHSRRIKMKIDVERAVLDGKAQIQHTIVVEFTVKMKQCMECIREATDHSWETCVQVEDIN